MSSVTLSLCCEKNAGPLSICIPKNWQSTPFSRLGETCPVRQFSQYRARDVLQHAEHRFDIVNLGPIRPNAAIEPRTRSGLRHVQFDMLSAAWDVDCDPLVNREVPLVRRWDNVALLNGRIGLAAQNVARPAR